MRRNLVQSPVTEGHNMQNSLSTVLGENFNLCPLIYTHFVPTGVNHSGFFDLRHGCWCTRRLRQPSELGSV